VGRHNTSHLPKIRRRTKASGLERENEIRKDKGIIDVSSS
jgi:hypothetical protein